MATYVMSDIHGRPVTFISVLDKIKLDKEKDTLYLLGDVGQMEWVSFSTL